MSNSSINLAHQSDSNSDGSSSESEASDKETDLCNLGTDTIERNYDDHQQPRPTTSRTSTLTVQRDEISSADLQEGDEELGHLGVAVYDQQAYEKSVFNQVDRAIEEAAATARKQNSDRDSSAKFDDLLRVVHGQSEDEEENETLTQDKNEYIIQLARQARLEREVKIEPNQLDKSYSTINLPRIPKLERIEVAVSSDKPVVDLKPNRLNTESASNITSFKGEHLSSNLDDDRILPSDDELSEFNPSEENSPTSDEDFDESVEFEPDSEPEGEIIPDSNKSKKIKDDGDFKSYQARIKAYTKARAKLRLDNILPDGTELKKLDELVTIEGALKIPKDIWENLYEHQRTGVRWLWELHQLGTGGILGDEMGLGKTIQMIAFLVALRSSNIFNSHRGYKNLGPTVLVCPATVMHQWLLEFRKWYPQFRVAILHNTGSFSGDRKKLIEVIHKSQGILICSFPGVVIYQDQLHNFDWHYAILDEGHKIRNPDAQVTLACKRFRTPHRIILSGSPVQNNLRELWSIFDFIYPGKLGTLPIFMGQFSIPITQGGYANATDLQVQIAYKCACILRDTIKPFLLRRTKAEVNSKLKLPEKHEQVLFCKLTEQQRKLYQSYLESPTIRDIKRGMCQIFVGLIQLRKICNHPDLFDYSECYRQIKQTKLRNENKIKNAEFFSTDETYGHHMKSGKMMVVEALLKLWKKQGHKVLLFTQSRLMLQIFINYLTERDYKYLTMDGSTPIGLRHNLIDKFNTKDDIFIFLLTTRVGGVGVNLIGANRIIIYDPDWNPSTDIQARERAWRIGQQRHVIIYRLLTAGTIEEKIYHRQVFKLYLTNRVLKDAKQKRFFKTNDLHELFTLGQDDKNLETKALFDDDLQIDEKSIKESRERKKIKKKKKQDKKDQLKDGNKKRRKTDYTNSPVKPVLTEQKLMEMRERAKRLSQMIATQYGSCGQSADKTEHENEGPHIKVEQSDDKLIGSSVRRDQPDDTRSTSFQHHYSPTIPIPYCPSFGKGNSKEIHLAQRKESTSKKQRVDFLVRQDVYKPIKEKHQKTTSSDADSRYEHDDYILGRLFKNANIFGALKHDKIESDSTADFKVVESEAERVARDAIRALRESRRVCLGPSSGIPNWTGNNGYQLSRPGLIPKNKTKAQQVMSRQPVASSSSSPAGDRISILNSIKQRNQSNPIPLNGNGYSRSNQLENDSEDEDEIDRDFVGKAKSSGADDMAEKIRQFVLYNSARNGEAQTEELLDFFKKNFKPEKTAIFKAILYRVCEFQRRGDKGFWKLRSEFRDLSF